MKTMSCALVACCSKAGLAVIRSLGARGVPVVGLCYGNSQSGASSRFLRDSIDVPDPSEDEQGFVDSLIALGRRFDGAVLFATDDGSLVAISKHAAHLSSLYRLVPQPWSLVRQLIEKHRTYDIARRHRIPCPRLIMASTVDECVAFARQIGFPCLLKPSVGHLFYKRFRQKMIMVNSERELLSHVDLIGGDRSIMLCEYIPGGDECGANYNSFALQGKALYEFTAEKVRNKPRLIGFPTVVRSVVMPEVQMLGRRVLAAFGIEDFSCTEFKLDPRDGQYKLMEVNARPNYSGALAVACGIDFPVLSYQRALGLPLERLPSRQTENVVWIDEERDVRGVVRAMGRGAAEAKRYIEPYRARKVFAVFRADDPLPAMALARTSIASLLRKDEAHRAARSVRQSSAQPEI